jgi:hypothetical protein
MGQAMAGYQALIVTHLYAHENHECADEVIE